MVDSNQYDLRKKIEKAEVTGVDIHKVRNCGHNPFETTNDDFPFKKIVWTALILVVMSLGHAIVSGEWMFVKIVALVIGAVVLFGIFVPLVKDVIASTFESDEDIKTLIIGIPTLMLMVAVAYFIHWTIVFSESGIGGLLTALGLMVVGYIIGGSVAVYTFYHGSRGIVYVTQKLWWVFISLIVGMVAYLQLKQ